MKPSSDSDEGTVTWAWIWRFSQFGLALAAFIWIAAQVYFDVSQLKKDVAILQFSLNKIEKKIDNLPPLAKNP